MFTSLEDLSRRIDDPDGKIIKVFEPDVAAQNEEGAADDAAVLRQGFAYTEKYFSKVAKGTEAVKISRDGLALLDEVSKHIAAKNFDAATQSARSVAEICKACHVIYKPKQARG